MGKITQTELYHYTALLKTVTNRMGDIFTQYICDDFYSDNRPKKRNYLTDIEIKIRFDLLKR